MLLVQHYKHSQIVSPDSRLRLHAPEDFQTNDVDDVHNCRKII